MTGTEHLLGGRPARRFEPKTGELQGEILYVHGWWGGSWVFDRIGPYLAEKGYGGWSLDLSGSRPDDVDQTLDVGRVSMDDQLDEVLSAVDLLENTLIVGHSIGGLLALKVATLRPLGAAVALVPAAPRGVVGIRNAKIVRFALTSAPAMLRRQPFLPSRGLMNELDLNRLPPDEQADVYRRMVPASGRQGFEAGLVGYPVSRRGLQCPALVVAASDDQLTPPRVTKAVANRFKSNHPVDLVEYPGRAHYLLREPGWQEIADDIAIWLSRQVSTG